MHRPKLLVMDEPTVGLDVESRASVWDFLQSLKAQGTAILIATHSMEEAERLSDRVAVIDKGRIAREGKAEALEAELEGNVLEVTLQGALPDDELIALVKSAPFVRHVARTRGGFEVSADKDPKVLGSLVELLDQRGRAVASASYRRPTLEDVFRRAVGRAFEEVS